MMGIEASESGKAPPARYVKDDGFTEAPDEYRRRA
jgi:hypothetical protein